MDNLPSATYQTFEQDPIKYSQYEEVSQPARVIYVGRDGLNGSDRLCSEHSLTSQRARKCTYAPLNEGCGEVNGVVQ